MQEEKEGEYCFGLALSQGIGGRKPELMKAADYFHEAASQGHTKAMVDLGVLYHTGQGVPRDHKKGVEYFNEAIEKGDEPEAYFLLGRATMRGEGVKRNMKKVPKCFGI